MSLKLLSIPLGLLALLSLVVPLQNLVFATTDDNTLSITGNDKTAALALKATESNGNTEKVDNFQLAAENVLQIEEDDDVRITDDVNFDKARTIDVNDNEEETEVDSDGNVDFDDYSQGTYVLQVITENGDRKLFEGIIVIGPEDQETIKKVIQKTIVEVIIDIDTDFDCDEGFTLKDGECVEDPSVCYFDPEHKDCEPVDGKCPPGFGFNDNDRCIPQGSCPDGYHRANDDETGTCIPEDELRQCEGDGGWVVIGSGEECPEDELPPIEDCGEGYQSSPTGLCEPVPPLYGECPGVYNPETGQCEEVTDVPAPIEDPCVIDPNSIECSGSGVERIAPVPPEDEVGGDSDADTDVEEEVDVEEPEPEEEESGSEDDTNTETGTGENGDQEE